MNDIINQFLLAGDKFMPEIHLRKPQFTYSACGRFTKSKERIQKLKETGDSMILLCIQHIMKKNLLLLNDLLEL